MDSPLSLDIQSIILNKTDLPIDTYLHFKKELDLVPKRLCCSIELTEKLDRQFERRVHHYNSKIQYERESNQQLSCSLDRFYQEIDDELSVEIIVDYDRNDDKMKLAFRINQTYVVDNVKEMCRLRKRVVDINNSK